LTSSDPTAKGIATEGSISREQLAFRYGHAARAVVQRELHHARVGRGPDLREYVLPVQRDDRLARTGLDVLPGGESASARAVRSTSLTQTVADVLRTWREWDAVSLLTVRVDRLTQWQRPGLLCIGDAAHAMSPAGGVGINLAIQDAVATANLLAGPLREGRVTEALLARVQMRRETIPQEQAAKEFASRK
jgi:2-polyprenyl-6-methoxyphenol hydroxylase-like FAD-dependent oxidoreductase